MAHFAELTPSTKIVKRVIAISNAVTYDENGQEHEDRGVALCQQLYGQHTVWVQTSYSGSRRGKYAAIGDRYDAALDRFIAP